MSDIKIKYPAVAAALTVTNLHSLAADSGALLAGWFSGAIDNTTNVDLDVLVSGTFTTHASNRQAGLIVVYAVAALGDATWPATATGTLGTEGAGSFTDTEERDSLCRVVAVITADATASAIYAFPPTSLAQLFGGVLPPTVGLFVTQSVSTTTTAGLAAAGSALYTKRIQGQIA